MNGYIKIHREIIDHWIFQKPEYLRAWVYMIVRANYKDRDILVGSRVVKLKRGEFITSRENFAEDTKISIQTVRTFWRLLEDEGLIKRKSTSISTKITICEYDTYQSEQPANNQRVTNEQPTNNQRVTTDKKDKKDKNGKEINIPFGQFWEVYGKKIARKDSERKWKNLTNKDRERIMDFLPRFLAGIRDKQYQPYPTTFLNQRRWEDEDGVPGRSPRLQKFIDLINELNEKRGTPKLTEFDITQIKERYPSGKYPYEKIKKMIDEAV